MEVGTLGDISFYVKQEDYKPKMLGLSDVSISSSAQWEEHARYGKKAYLEFVSPGLEELNLTIYASAQYGVNPWKIRKQLNTYSKAGTPNYFVMGGKVVGANRWVITDISGTVTVIYTNGRPMAMQFALTLKEYANPLKKETATTKKTTTKTTSSTSGKASSGSTVKKQSYITYTIKSGDTLWGLAVKYYGSGAKYTKIYNANKKVSKGFNKITDPNKISVGWVIKIPK